MIINKINGVSINKLVAAMLIVDTESAYRNYSKGDRHIAYLFIEQIRAKEIDMDTVNEVFRIIEEYDLDG
jgi:hypothetical protein